MNSNNNLNKETLNGWQNLGKLAIWTIGKLSPSENVIYSLIARYSVGYCQTTTPHLGQKQIADELNLSLNTVKQNMKKLLDKKFIIKLKSNRASETGKKASKYSLNFKLEGFPYLTVGSINKPNIAVNTSKNPKDYFINYLDKIHPIIDPITKTKSKAFIEDADWKFTNNEEAIGTTIHPTPEQLWDYLERINSE